MKRKRRSRFRRLLALVALMAFMAWTAGCAAGQSIGLSALLPADEDSLLPDVGEQLPGADDALADNSATNNGAAEGTAAVYVPETDSDTAGQELVVLPAESDFEEESGQESSSEGENAGTPPVEQKLAALTFDDGPDAKYTTAILDILKKKGVKATFFVVGTQVEKYPDVMKRIVEEGHAIGNHSQGHKDLRELDRAGILEQMTEADEAIDEAVGITPELFRAPYGAVSDTLLDVLQENDRRLVGWTVDTRDWAGTSISDMREMIRKKTEANGIILMHSFGGKHIRNTVEMLPSVIDDLQELGFTLVTVDQIQE